MTSRFTKFLLFSFALVGTYTLSSYSNAGGGTVSGNAVSGCSCHGSANINTVISVLGLPSSGYTPGQVYPVNVLIENQTMASVGINLAVNIGTISNLGAGLTSVNATSIRHSSPAALVGGEHTFTFNWTAPSSGSTNLTLNASVNAVDGTGGTGGDQWNSFVSTTPLSLSYIQFNAIAKANQVNLTWQTTKEEDITYFIIERSEDGVKYDSIDIVKSLGNATTGSEYSYIDKPAHSNEYYYRVIILSASGNKMYAPTQKITFNNGASLDFILFPNPSGNKGKLNINLFNNRSKNVSLNVFLQNGNLVHSQNQPVKNGTNYLELHTVLPKGYYLMELKTSDNNTLTKKFVVN